MNDIHASDDPERGQAAVEASVEAIIEEKRAKQRALEANSYAAERARRVAERDRKLTEAQSHADRERNELGAEANRQFAAYAHSRGRTTFADRLAATSERYIADHERRQAREAWLQGERPTPDV
ncbi:hypothetical protein [Rhodococcus sp. ACT016]|uniref:hypothetical protein n=1 Tax=Rhodococcus sp. ACT016 TaxID=3134808 RepID=UPI003D2B3243